MVTVQISSGTVLDIHCTIANVHGMVLGMPGTVSNVHGTVSDVHGTVSNVHGNRCQCTVPCRLNKAPCQMCTVPYQLHKVPCQRHHGECARVHGTVSVYYSTAFLKKWHHDSLTRHRVRCTRYQDSIKWYVTVWAPELSTQSTESNKRIGKWSLGRGVAHREMQTYILVQVFV